MTATAWFNADWFQANTLFLIVTALVIAVAGGLWRNSPFGQFFSREEPAELAHRWISVADGILGSLQELHVPHDDSSFFLPKDASEAERDRTWRDSIRRSEIETSRSIRVMKTRHLTDLQNSLVEIQRFSDENLSFKVLEFSTNQIQWERAALFLTKEARKYAMPNLKQARKNKI